MPRQKNRGQQYFFPTYQAPTRTRRWKMASYIRLSKENLQKIKKGWTAATASRTSGIFSITFTKPTPRNLKASGNMWMTAILERTPTGAFSGNAGRYYER